MPGLQEDQDSLERRVWPLGRNKTKVPDVEMGAVNHVNAPRPSSGGSGPSGSNHPPPRPASPAKQSDNDLKCTTCGNTHVDQKKLDIEKQKMELEAKKKADLHDQNQILNAQKAKNDRDTNISTRCQIGATLCAAGIYAAASWYKGRDVDSEGWQMPTPYRKIMQRNYIDAEFMPLRL